MARPTCEGCRSIDVRRWRREGRLLEGQHFSYSRSCAGNAIWQHQGAHRRRCRDFGVQFTPLAG
jgi:uncharacterized protein YfiM (DUF2279 family)